MGEKERGEEEWGEWREKGRSRKTAKEIEIEKEKQSWRSFLYSTQLGLNIYSFIGRVNVCTCTNVHVKVCITVLCANSTQKVENDGSAFFFCLDFIFFI